MPKSLSTSPKKVFRRDFTLMVIGQIISLFGNAILRFSPFRVRAGYDRFRRSFCGDFRIVHGTYYFIISCGRRAGGPGEQKKNYGCPRFRHRGNAYRVYILFQSTPSVALIGAAMVILSIINPFTSRQFRPASAPWWSRRD